MKALIVPCARLAEDLLRWLDSLPLPEFAVVVVVADGGAILPEIEAALRARGVMLARHAVPVGRGAAIRTGLHAVLAAAPDVRNAIVASDANAAPDIARVGAKPDALTLASRGGRMDWAARALAGIRVSDSRAPLRSIPGALIPHLLTLESRGAEFDVETLVVAREHSIPIAEANAGTSREHGSSAGTLLRFLASTTPERAVTRLLAFLCFAVFAAATGLSAWGFAGGHLFQQFIWLPWGFHRLTHFAALFAGWSVPVLAVFPWAYASLFPALLTGATVLAEGPAAVAAVLFFLFSANALGTKLARRLPGKGEAPALIATLAGIGIYVLLMTLSARLPVHYPALWIGLLTLPIAADLPGAAQRLRSWRRMLASVELPRWRLRAAFALLLFVLCIHWFAALEPEATADGLAMHLAIPADIAAHHALTFQPGLFVWSVMPMAADFAYSIVYLMGGEAAASLLNFALLALLTGLIYTAARRFVSAEIACIFAALFASTPLVNLVTGSLFIENFVAAMIFGLALELWRYRETGEPRALMLAAVLGGTACSAKLGACAFVLVALLFAAVEARRRRVLKPALLAASTLLLFAAPAYVIAYALTGNPVFPFINTKYPSPLLEHGIEFRNNQFTQPLTWHTPFDLTFHTHQYIEGLDGAIGFAYLLLIPLALIALFAARSYGARLAAAIALVAGAMVMSSQPYARYIYPAMALLFIPFADLAGRFTARHRVLLLALLAGAGIALGLNIYFTPVSGWHHKDFYAPAIFRPGGRQRVIQEEIPLRDVTIRFRQAHPHDHVMLLVEEDLADAGASAYEYHWHQYGIWKQIAGASSVTVLRRVFSRLGVRYFVSRLPGPDDDLLSPWPFAEFLANCTTPILQNGRFYAAEVTPECQSLSDAHLEARLATLPPALVSAGVYDDFDTAIRFHGAWTRSKAFAGPFRHSISYTDAPGAEAAFAFEGSSLTYLFTRSANRGIADLEIDGMPHELDLYAPAVQWQSRIDFCCLAPGSHLVVLRATGRKRAEAQDVYIDLDAFIAR